MSTFNQVKNPEYTWQKIRSAWVNGEQKTVIGACSKLPRDELLKLVIQAIQEHERSLAPGTTRSGDLTDIKEILTKLS